ncbi:MAG: hypothetical protein HYU29_03450 [Chloroflexi bacterium]|nr:hypothetical protein [Chloroflexota bacterium]
MSIIRILKRFKSTRPHISLLLALLLGGILIFMPAEPASSFTATLNTDKGQALSDANPKYKLGGKVQLIGALSIAANETVPATVDLELVGPSPFGKIPISLTEGTQTLTSQLPGNFRLPDPSWNKSNVSLTATVSFSGIVASGSGFKGGASGGTINITVNYKHPITKFPLPAAAAGPLQNPTLRFSLGQAGGGGQQQPTTPTFPTFKFKGIVFSVPFTAPDGEIRGADFASSSLHVVMDGFPGDPDVVAQLDPMTLSPVNFFKLPSLGGSFSNSEIHGLAKLSNGDVVVVGGISGNFFAAIVRPPTSPTGSATLVDTVALASSVGFDNRPGGVDVRPGSPQRVFISEREPDASKEASVYAINIKSNGEFDDNSVTTFDVGLGTVGKPGFDALEFNQVPETPTLLGTANGPSSSILEFDQNGFFVNLFNPATDMGMIINDIQGLGFKAATSELVAVTKMREVFVSKIGAVAAVSGISTTPNFISKGGSEIFVGFEGEPKDGVRVYDPSGNNLREFNLPSNDVEAGAFVAGSPPALYVYDNVANNIKKLSITNGSVLSTISVPGYFGSMGGMGVDGDILYLYEQFSDIFHSINIQTGNPGASLTVKDNNFQDQFWPPGGADALEVVNLTVGKRLLAGKFGTLYVINPSNGNLETGFFTTVGKIVGLGTGSVLLVDEYTQNVYEATLPGEPPPEKTTKGTYDARLYKTSSDFVKTTFTLETVDTLEVKITSPKDGSGVSASDLDADGKIAVSGTVNDPTVDEVAFGAVLAKTTLVGAPVTAPTGPLDLETEAQRTAVKTTTTSPTNDWEAKGLWHVTGDPSAPGGKKYNDGFGFYYGRDGSSPQGTPSGPNFTYETPGVPNTGDLDSPTFAVGTDTVLSFNTWFSTEPEFNFDQKLIQFCTSAASCTTLAQIVDFPPPPQPPFFQPPTPPLVYDPSQVGANFPPFNDGRKFIFIPSNAFNPFTGQIQLFKIELKLSKALGTGFLRFKFDTKDPSGNFFEGWYTDDVQVVGAGAAAGASVAVTNSAWSGKVKITDGKNKIDVNTSRSAYEPVLTDSDTVNVFLDSAAPIVSFDTPNLGSKVVNPTVFVTNKGFLQNVIKGRFTELTPSSLEIFKLFNESLTSLLSKNVFTDADSKLISSQKVFDSSTLSANSAIGATSISVADASNLAVGELIQVGTGTDAEVRTVTAKSSNNLTLSSALEKEHESGGTVAEVGFDKDVDLGTTDGYIKLGAKLTDKGGASGTAQIILQLDKTKPAIDVGTVISPIGAVSARALDPLIFDITASDIGSGIDQVLFLLPGAGKLSAVAAVGDTQITVAGQAFSAGKKVVIGKGTSAELRTVNTASGNGLSLTLNKALDIGHAADEQVREAESLPSAASIPDVVLGKFGLKGTHEAFVTVPAGTPTGQFSIDVAVLDLAGNADTKEAKGTIDASLKALNYYLGPGSNLIGMNLQPTAPSWTDLLAQVIDKTGLATSFVSGLSLGSTTSSATVSVGATSIAVNSLTGLAVGDVVKIGASSEVRRITAINTSTKVLTLNTALAAGYGSGTAVVEQVKLADIVKAVYYFTGGTAVTGEWQVFNFLGATNTLTQAKQGRAYWIITKDEAFKSSAPLPGFTSGTPIPVRIQVDGVFFDATVEPPTLPATVDVVPGWNLATVISERDRKMKDGLRSLFFPERILSAVAEFQKFVEFDATAAAGKQIEIVGGVFNPLFEEDLMKIGRGFYIFVAKAGTITP